VKSVRKRRYDCDGRWEEAFCLYRGQLQFYAAYLLPCGCTEEIVAQVEDRATNFMVPDDFKLGYLLRTMVQSVLYHLGKCNQRSDICKPKARSDPFTGVESLNPQERLAYFLLEIFEYRTRDAALLMGISDARVEQMLVLARRQMERVNDTDTSEAGCTMGSTPIGVIPTPAGCESAIVGIRT
jgi:hypothetical protein